MTHNETSLDFYIHLFKNKDNIVKKEHTLYVNLKEKTYNPGIENLI